MLEDGHEYAGAQLWSVVEVRRVCQARECALERVGAEVRQMWALREVVRVLHGALELGGAVRQAHGGPEVVRECAREQAGADVW